MFAEFFTPEQIAILTQIILIDLVLAGDNAIIIGMVASKFPVEQRKKVIFWGIGGAVILRIILTYDLFISYLNLSKPCNYNRPERCTSLQLRVFRHE